MAVRPHCASSLLIFFFFFSTRLLKGIVTHNIWCIYFIYSSASVGKYPFKAQVLWLLQEVFCPRFGTWGANQSIHLSGGSWLWGFLQGWGWLPAPQKRLCPPALRPWDLQPQPSVLLFNAIFVLEAFAYSIFHQYENHGKSWVIAFEGENRKRKKGKKKKRMLF